MKKLYLVRHAKSSWKNPDLRDFDRPLNSRGKRDAPFMGKLLREKGIKPNTFITSPALRALTTAIYFAEELEYPEEKILRDENLYDADVMDILNVLSAVKNKNESIMVFTHNPGLTNFCNYISDQYIENIPTSAVVSLVLKVDQWNELDEKSCTTEFFEYPKKYFK